MYEHIFSESNIKQFNIWNCRLKYLITGKIDDEMNNEIIVAPRTIGRTYTQSEFADAYNDKYAKEDDTGKIKKISQSDVSRWVSVGNFSKNKQITYPTPQTMIKLAKFFSVSVDYLLGLSDFSSPEKDYIGSQIGLSEQSIDLLKKPRETIFWKYLSLEGKKDIFYNALNSFLSCNDFMELIAEYEQISRKYNDCIILKNEINKLDAELGMAIKKDKNMELAFDIEMGAINEYDETAPEISPELSTALGKVRERVANIDTKKYKFNKDLEQCNLKKYGLTIAFAKILDALLPELINYDLP